MPLRITKQRFNAFIFGIRGGLDDEEWTDVSYWSTTNGAVLAGLFYVEKSDAFLGALFLRDANKRFKCLPPLLPFRTKRSGENAIIDKLTSIETRTTPLQEIESDEHPGVDLWTVSHETPLNPIFENIRDSEHSRAAKAMLTEIAHWHEDRDCNFVRDFQTTGTSARLWELFLFRVFRNLNFELDTSYSVPDFCLERDGLKLFVEATTANATDPKHADIMTGPTPKPDDFWTFIENDMPIIFGSPLYTKQQKAYWDKEPVQGHPFAIAIADFHAPSSMTWSHTALPIYLYGISVERVKGQDGDDIALPKPLDTHRKGEKEIPSGFFNQPGTEHISAVIFSNAGTKSKFTRMGTLAGFGGADMTVHRAGVIFDPDPDALDGIPFEINIENPEYHEDWHDEIEIYHNPHAATPWPDETVIPEVAHFKLEGEELIWRGWPFRPLTSTTYVEKRPPYSDEDKP